MKDILSYTEHPRTEKTKQREKKQTSRINSIWNLMSCSSDKL